MSIKNENNLIDVSLTYFGIPIDEEKLERIGCEDMDCNKRNPSITRNVAIKAFKNIYPLQCSEIAYCSTNAIIANRVKDYYGTRIFAKVESYLVGWLFFVDEMPFANWKHDCKYFFVVDEDVFFYKTHTVGISDNVQMKEIR